jgi:hypothetical protein
MARKHSVGMTYEEAMALSADAEKQDAGLSSEEMQAAPKDDWSPPVVKELVGVRPMDTAPRTGVPIILLDDGRNVFAVAKWRVTRVRQRIDGLLRWVPAEFWVLANVSGNPRVPFEPVGWMEYDGFAS